VETCALTRLNHFVRAAALAGLSLLTSAPAFAGPTEVALLKSYLGDWRGRGVLIGADTETVVCRLSLTEGNEDKVNYNGRCTLAGTQLSVAGTVAYIEANKRYEAAMTTNATFNGLAVGQKRGTGLVFNLRERDEDETGKDINITSQITLKPEAIGVVFEIVYVESGDNLRAEVPFTR
jgi:hypothetical protein